MTSSSSHEPPTKEQWCQPTFATRRFKDHKGKLASFECCFAHNITTVNQSGEVTYKITHEVGTQVEHEPDKDEFRFVDREVGTDPMAVCYQGYQSVVANGTLRQLTSVSQDHFELLLGCLYDLKPRKMKTEDHLLLFLMKFVVDMIQNDVPPCQVRMQEQTA